MASPQNGNTSNERWENLRRHQQGEPDMGKAQRVVSGLAGVTLMALTLRTRKLRTFLVPVATGLIAKALTGRPGHQKLSDVWRRKDKVSPVASIGRGQGIKVEESVTINRPVVEVYRFWRNFENLPRFMDHLEAVTVLDDTHSRWVAKGPAGTRVEWDAVIHNEVDDELIAWRSLPGSEVSNAGSVHFTPTPDGAGTDVRVVLSYDPPAGKLGAAVAKLLGEEPSKQVAEDLRRFKQVMDSGDVMASSRPRAGRA